MPNDSLGYKKKIIHAILEFLPHVSGDQMLDLGDLVLFLERQASDWIDGHHIDLKPLWHYCQKQGAWSEQRFSDLGNKLMERFADEQILWDLPFANEYPPTYADYADIEPDGDTPDHGESTVVSLGLEQLIQLRSESDQVIDWIIDGVKRSPVQSIIDPDKLRNFLSDAYEEMWEQDSLNLQLLWDVLADADGVDEEMLLKCFLIMQVDYQSKISVAISWPSLVNKVSEKMKNALLASLGIAESGKNEPTIEAKPDYSSAYAISTSPRAEAATNSPKKNATPSSIKAKSNPFKTLATAPSGLRSPATLTPSQGNEIPPIDTELPIQPNQPINQSTTSERSRARMQPHTFKPISAQNTTTLPPWAWWIGLSIAVFSVLYYFLFVYQSTPSWLGTPIDITAYSKIISAQDMRLHKRSLNIKATAEFMALSDAAKFEKIYELWQKFSQKHTEKVWRIVLFSPTGQMLNVYEMR
jgi:hypothetical protein